MAELRINTVRKCPRITPAENGLILNWTEYAISENQYDGLQWIGDKNKIFKVEESEAAVKELLEIAKEEKRSQLLAATVKFIQEEQKEEKLSSSPISNSTY